MTFDIRYSCGLPFASSNSRARSAGRTVAGGSEWPKKSCELPQIFDSVRVRILVYPIDQRKVLTQAEGGHRLVREDHKVLNDPVRLEAQPRADLEGLPVSVQDNFRLGNRKVDRPRLPAGPADFPRHR